MGNGLPTGMAQSCPGSPCAGFKRAVVAGAETAGLLADGLMVTEGVLLAGALLSGAPTGISQRWPGWPCSGLRATAPLAGICCTAA